MYARETKASGNIYKHMWDVSTVEVYDGGFLLDTSNLPAGTKMLPRGSFMAVDLEERIAKAVKTVALHEAITAASTIVKVKKSSLLVKGDVIGIGDKSVIVGDVDRTESTFDSFDIEAGALGEVPITGALQQFVDGKPANVDGFNYEDKKIDGETSVSVIYRVDKVVAEALPSPITDEIIASLKHCQILKK